MYSEDYSALFYKKSSYRPDELTQAWNATIERIEQGYDDVEPELDYDLDLRSQIKSLMRDPDLQQMEDDHRFLQETIESIDLRLKALVFDNPFYPDHTNKEWWQRIILKKGRKRYYEDILKTYQIRIELVP